MRFATRFMIITTPRAIGDKAEDGSGSSGSSSNKKAWEVSLPGLFIYETSRDQLAVGAAAAGGGLFASLCHS